MIPDHDGRARPQKASDPRSNGLLSFCLRYGRAAFEKLRFSILGRFPHGRSETFRVPVKRSGLEPVNTSRKRRQATKAATGHDHARSRANGHHRPHLTGSRRLPRQNDEEGTTGPFDGLPDAEDRNPGARPRQAAGTELAKATTGYLT